MTTRAASVTRITQIARDTSPAPKAKHSDSSLETTAGMAVGFGGFRHTGNNPARGLALVVHRERYTARPPKSLF